MPNFNRRIRDSFIVNVKAVDIYRDIGENVETRFKLLKRIC